MSFSAEVKRALCSAPVKPCCRLRETRAIFLFGGVFSPEEMSFRGSASTAERAKGFLRRDFDVYAEVAPAGGGVTLAVPGAGDRRRILARLQAEKAGDCCKIAALRGAFLAAGYLNSPEKGYRLEFAPKSGAEELADLLRGAGLPPKTETRRGREVLYFRESREIEDFLTCIGAPDAALEIMGQKIYRDMLNKSNRQRNCDDANITKTVNAATRETAAIGAIIAAGRLDSLSPELREAAALRLANPEAPLRELCDKSPSPVTKVTLSRRLRRLIELAGQLTGEKPAGAPKSGKPTDEAGGVPDEPPAGFPDKSEPNGQAGARV